MGICNIAIVKRTSRTFLLTTARIVLSVFVVCSIAPGFAQTTCPEPQGYALLRQDDDYGYLRDPQCRKDFWDSVKYRPLTSTGDRYLTIGGEIRERYEGFHNANFGMGPQDSNGFLLQRMSLYSDWHVGNSFRFFGQLTSDIEAGRNGGPQPNDEDKLWVEQGFVDISPLGARDTSLTFRIGRQEFEFGSGRLVDVREGPNVRLAFDGVDVIVKGAKWNVNAFATRPVINNVNVFDDAPDHTVMFWGTYAVRALPATRGGSIDLYYLGIDKKQAKFDRGTAQEIRHTLGTRFWGTKRAWTYNWEAMLQWGTFGTSRVRAWGIATDTEYKFSSVPLKPQPGIRMTLTSGDRPQDSGALGTLNPLFPTGIYFGEGAVGLNGPSNLIRVGGSVKLHLATSVLLIGDYDGFWRQSLQDGVYGLGVNLLRSGIANGERYIGSQPSMGIYWQTQPSCQLVCNVHALFCRSLLCQRCRTGTRCRLRSYFGRL